MEIPHWAGGVDAPWRVENNLAEGTIRLHVKDGVVELDVGDIAVLQAALVVSAELAVEREADYDGAVPLGVVVEAATAARLRALAEAAPGLNNPSSIAEVVVENYAATLSPTFCFEHRAECGDAHGRHTDNNTPKEEETA